MLAFYADWLARLSDHHYLAYLVILVVVTLGLMGAGVFFVRRAYWISNTATSRIASAHQGYVEIEGAAKGEAGVFPLVSPLSGTSCVWFEVSVDQDGQPNGWIGNRKPHRIFHQVSDHLIVVDDGSGECVVDPDGATIFPERIRVWRGETERPSHASAIRTNKYVGPYRYTEKLILDQDPLYVLGWFKTIRHDAHQLADDSVRDLLRSWKQDPNRMKSFDTDGNGVIDEAEWRAARQAAKDIVRQKQVAEQDVEKSHVHTMSNPESQRRPFIISALDQTSLAGRYRRWGYALWLLSAVSFYLWVTAYYLRG